MKPEPTRRGSGLTDAQNVRPVDIDLRRTERLRITWSDGHVSEYPLALLRRNCPCAQCRTHRAEQASNPLAILNTGGDQRAMTTVRDAGLAGHYAIRLTWEDGHDTGIYDYRLLRALCPCARCRGGA